MNCILLLLMKQYLFAQPVDTTTSLNPVTVKAYFGVRPSFSIPSSIAVIGQSQLQAQQPWSSLPALNAVSGVKMDERSPGSYRLSVRGSLIRSPYGVRNVKIYIDNFMLTDAGGNSYLGSLDNSALNRLEIIKGPEGSIYGANTGGVLLIDPNVADTTSLNGVEAGIAHGSYGLFHQYVKLEKSDSRLRLSFQQAWQRADGYRANSAMNRRYYQLKGAYRYAKMADAHAFLFYSDMHYRTPGGLTQAQMESDPRAARPATAMSPGAAEQHAGIYNKTVFGGLSNSIYLTEGLHHVVALTGAYTDFKNPFITNYETRYETTGGLRTYLEWKTKPSGKDLGIQLGLEAQSTSSRIRNYGNRQGLRDTIQSSDNIRANQSFVFLHASADLSDRFLIEGAMSVNIFGYNFRNIYPYVSSRNNRNFKRELLPRLALSYTWPRISWRASVSRGYSSPTIAEIRPSDQAINESLNAEAGWNLETGVRVNILNGRLYADVTAFQFDMNNAIIRQLNEEGNEFFRNAGEVRQRGIETKLDALLIPLRSHGWLRRLMISNSVAYNRFFFLQYESGESSFSGNRLTGVPRGVVTTSADVALAGGFAVQLTHNYNSRTPLNDANSVWASAFNLLQTKFSYGIMLSAKYKLSLYAGVDNLLNETYSLGNDLNAFGGRYFNPAPKRNYYGGIALKML